MIKEKKVKIAHLVFSGPPTFFVEDKKVGRFVGMRKIEFASHDEAIQYSNNHHKPLHLACADMWYKHGFYAKFKSQCPGCGKFRIYYPRPNYFRVVEVWFGFSNTKLSASFASEIFFSIFFCKKCGEKVARVEMKAQQEALIELKRQWASRRMKESL